MRCIMAILLALCIHIYWFTALHTGVVRKINMHTADTPLLREGVLGVYMLQTFFYATSVRMLCIA